MWKDEHPFDVGQPDVYATGLPVATGNLCGMGAIYTAVRVWRVLQEGSLASLPSLQPAIISGNGERLYIEALARASR